MPNFTYAIHIDTLLTGTFGGSIDNVADLVLDMAWQSGFDAPRGQLAQPSQATIRLENVDSGAPCAPFNYEYTGAEKLTNGNFSSWSAGAPTGWTKVGFAAPNAYLTQVGTNETYGGTGTGAANLYRVSGGAVSIRQTGLTIGRTYRAKVNITALGSDNVAGVCFADPAVGGETSPLYQTTGIKTWVFVAQGSEIELRLISTATANVTIDDVSVVEVCKYAMVAPGAAIRISSSDAYGIGTPLAQTVFWTGRISEINPTYDPQSGSIDGRAVTLVCEDPFADWMSAEYAPALMQNTTVDAVLGAILDEGIGLWPYQRGGFMLGVEGAAALDISATIAPTDSYRALDAGESLLPWVGDASDRDQGVSPYSYMQDVAAAELGRIFWGARNAQYAFHSRNHDAANTTPLLTVDNTLYDTLSLAYGTPIYNQVTVVYTERQIGAAGSVVWSADNLPIQIQAGGTRTFSARYRLTTEDTAQIAAINPIEPMALVDFIANTTSDGSGDDMSAFLTANVQWAANSAKVTITNSALKTVYLRVMQIRATPLIARPGEITLRDGESIFNNGLRPAAPLNLVYVDSADTAELLGHHLLGVYKTPMTFTTRISVVANRSSTTANMAFSLTVGNRIALTESGLGHDQDYIVVGEAHRVDATSKVHQVDYVLRPTARETYWRLDESMIGVDTRLAF